MKIALVLTPFLYKRCPLIGLAYLAANLKSKGHEVVIFDLNAEMEALAAGEERAWSDESFTERFFNEHRVYFENQVENILQSQAKIIGFSMWTSTKHISLALVRMIKQRDKSRLIVLGGPECSFLKKSFIQEQSVDIVVLGEGEQTFTEIAQTYAMHGSINFCSGTLLKINQDVIDCGERPEIKDLNYLPFPDFSGFILNRYYLDRTLPIIFNRGCLRRCVFCNTAVTWKKCRSRSAENIFAEINYQRKNYPNLQRFEVEDSALNINLQELSNLCDLINTSDLKFSWGGAAIIHPEMDFNLLKKMSQAGCSCLSYGLESGSQKVVDGMQKGFKMEAAERLIRDTHNACIEVLLNIVIGFPNETEDDFLQTVNFIKRNKNYIYSIAIPSECSIGNNTYLHTHPEEFNVDLAVGGEWRTRDGLNTHELRQKRMQIFNYFVNSIGVKLQVSKLPE
jgi:radical SAM superfamily enzyme YgiQ (UPF0313 family)